MTDPGADDDLADPRLEELRELLGPVFERAAVGDFSQDVPIPDRDDDLAEVYVGVQVMLEVIREQVAELRSLNEDLEAKVEERTAKLRRSNEDLERFAYVASHDLREPLRMVTQYLQLLERRAGDKLGEDEAEFLHFAVDGAQRMDGLIRDLLEWSRVDRFGAEPEPVEARKALDRALDNLSVQVEAAGAQVDVGPLPVVPADGPQLTQVFQNLVGNALDHADGAAPKIRVRAALEEDAWCFEVEDDGPGIDPQVADRIFEVFYSGNGEGSGIGLAIVKRIVERHGGRVGVDPAPGDGSTFWFTLPATRRSPEAAPELKVKSDTLK